MEEQIISFETAKLAKKKGFKSDEDIKHFYSENYGLVYYNGKHDNYYLKEKDIFLNSWDKSLNLGNVYPSVTQSLLQKWLRDIYNIHLYVNYYKYSIQMEDGYYYYIDESAREAILYGFSQSYEEALEKGLYEALKLIKIE